MLRKDESILNLLVESPWWVSVLVSGVTFLAIKFLLPSIEFGSMAANSFAKGLSGVNPVVAIVLLLPAPIAALNSWLKRKKVQRIRIGEEPTENTERRLIERE